MNYDKNDLCYGCSMYGLKDAESLYEKDKPGCLYISSKTIEQFLKVRETCPCIGCLLKSICKYRFADCDIFETYIHLYYHPNGQNEHESL